MKLFRVVAAAVASVMLVGSAAAADPAPVYIPAVAPMTVAAPAPAFSFAGMYFGVTSLEVRTLSGAGLVGFNIVRGPLLAGIELRLGGGFQGGGALIASSTARAGVVLGSRTAVYGLAGLGFATDFADFESFYTFGAGLEFAVSDRVSVFGETRAIGQFGLGADCCIVQVGVRVHR